MKFSMTGQEQGLIGFKDHMELDQEPINTM
jgi:hypothetical protein